MSTATTAADRTAAPAGDATGTDATGTDATGTDRRAAPGFRFFSVTVARTLELGPSFRRLTLAGPALTGFGAGGDDQRIKLVFSRDGRPVEGLLTDGPGWYQDYCALPDDVRPYLRTYTVRAARPEIGEIDVDVVLHGVGTADAGPAATWAAAAAPGDPVVLLGPDRPGRGRAWGVEWAPPPVGPLFLAGDETAVPAIGAILEGLPDGRRAIAVLEVPTAGDVLPLAVPPGVAVRWLVRGDREHGAALEPAVHAALVELGIARPAGGDDPEDVDLERGLLWEVPDSRSEDCYAWLAGEAGMVKALRRRLVRDLGLPRTAVAFMGYWRRGAAEGS